jgi:hypothetical protein
VKIFQEIMFASVRMEELQLKDGNAMMVKIFPLFFTLEGFRQAE